MIVILASSTEDLTYLIEKAKVISTKEFGKAVVIEAILCDKKVLLVATGYNKINLGMAAGYVAANYTIDAMIGIGNCGYLCDCGIRIEDIAIGASSVQYSVNSSAIGYPDTVIPDVGRGIFFSNPMLIETVENACKKLGYKYLSGKIATGEKFIANNQERTLIAQKYDSQFIDMECGGAGEIAFILNKPVVFVKGISNYAGNNAAIDFQNYANCANVRSCEITMQMLMCMPVESDCDCRCDCKEIGKCDVNLKHFREMSEKENRWVIDRCSYVNLGVSENNVPYVVPMCFSVDGEYSNRIKLLSAPYGKKVTCMENNNNVVLEFVLEGERGVKTVVAFGKAMIPTCNNCEGMMAIIVEIYSMTGREYYSCR